MVLSKYNGNAILAEVVTPRVNEIALHILHFVGNFSEKALLVVFRDF
jgi:hypothetical protein